MTTVNYRQSTATATAWRRCNAVALDNPLEGTRTVRFFEQDVAALGARVMATPAGFIEKPYDPAGVFPLLDPETAAPTGQAMTHAALYQALFSLYMQTAAERDADQQPE